MKSFWFYSWITFIVLVATVIYLSEYDLIRFPIPVYIIDVIVAILVLHYVKDTYSLVELQTTQNQIARTPVLTARVVNKGEEGDWGRVPNDKDYTKINLLIINHTSIHANLKISVTYSGSIAGKQFKGTIEEGVYNGREIWDFPAQGKILGNFRVHKFSGFDKIERGDEIYLTISIQSKPHNINTNYNSNPDLRYYWNSLGRKWIFSPVA